MAFSVLEGWFLSTPTKKARTPAVGTTCNTKHIIYTRKHAHMHPCSEALQYRCCQAHRSDTRCNGGLVQYYTKGMSGMFCLQRHVAEGCPVMIPVRLRAALQPVGIRTHTTKDIVDTHTRYMCQNDNELHFATKAPHTTHITPKTKHRWTGSSALIAVVTRQIGSATHLTMQDAVQQA